MANLSQKKRQRMLDFLEKIKNTCTDEEAVIAINEIENELVEKKYGLVWEEHEENVDVQMRENVLVFSEDKEREIIANPLDETYNFLIEGDNLHSLKLLEKTHKGKIDVIYIDPPYNTGNRDFRYNDAFVNSDDTFRHSMWLSFMYKRLFVAKTLLKDDGYIFISINDVESAQLKLLLDELFGEENFISQLVWESTTQPINVGNARFNIQKKTEPIYVYARNAKCKRTLLLDKKENDLKYPHVGRFGKCRFEIIEKSDAGAYSRQSMKFEILGQKPRSGKRWQIGEDTARELEAKGRLEIVDGVVKKAVYPEDEVERVQYIPFWSLLSATEVGTAQAGKDELNKIMGYAVGFDTVKPVKLIKTILSHFKNDIVVLDFFAGSGTTAQAVMEMNRKDNGKRKVILCTDNENKICEEITYKRLLNLNNAKDNEGILGNLKYYKTSLIVRNKDNFYSLGEELTKHIKEMIQLEWGISIDNDKYFVILSDEEADELEQNPEKIANCRAVYIAGSVFLTASQSRLFENIAMITIPDYYFEEEMREVGEL